MLKNRLARLEQSINQKHDEEKLYMVYRDEDENQMKIPDFNFIGTLENGSKLMEQYPRSIFVIWNMAMERAGRKHGMRKWRL